MSKIILEIENLNVRFDTPEGEVSAISGVSLALEKGKMLGVVGESGSGKSQLFLSMMGLLANNGKTSGRIMYEGNNLLTLKQDEFDKIRGRKIAMIFQDPMTSLNPSLRISVQMNEVLQKHRGMNKAQATQRSIEMLRKVGIPEAEKRFTAYPHELSGGMRQRVMIAIALLCEPDLLIADEPTTALDVTIQAQILRLFHQLRDEFDTSIVFITHDLGVVAELCDEVMVLYGGRVMEKATTTALFAEPSHPYTAALLKSIPRIGKKQERLFSIDGQPPNLQNLPKGCAFRPRCNFAKDQCLENLPHLEELRSGHKRACFHEGELV